MKIAIIDEFLKLPKGTIFSEFDGGQPSGLFRKEDTIEHPGHVAEDFFYSNICAEKAENTINIGEVCRWGLFDATSQFLVYEDKDVHFIIGMLTNWKR